MAARCSSASGEGMLCKAALDAGVFGDGVDCERSLRNHDDEEETAAGANNKTRRRLQYRKDRKKNKEHLAVQSQPQLGQTVPLAIVNEPEKHAHQCQENSAAGVLLDKIGSLQAAVERLESRTDQVDERLSTIHASLDSAAASSQRLEHDRLQNEVERLRKQRDAARLQILVQKGKVQKYRRSLGWSESSEEDNGSDDQHLEESSSEDQDSDEEYESEFNSERAVEEETDEDEDGAQSPDDVSPEVFALQQQMWATQDLINLPSFRNSAKSATMTKIQALRESACHACAHLASQRSYDAEPIIKWAQALQRALDAAVRETFPMIKEDIQKGTCEKIDGVEIFAYSSLIWKALSWTCRNDLIN